MGLPAAGVGGDGAPPQVRGRAGSDGQDERGFGAAAGATAAGRLTTRMCVLVCDRVVVCMAIGLYGSPSLSSPTHSNPQKIQPHTHVIGPHQEEPRRARCPRRPRNARQEAGGAGRGAAEGAGALIKGCWEALVGWCGLVWVWAVWCVCTVAIAASGGERKKNERRDERYRCKAPLDSFFALAALAWPRHAQST